MFSVSFVKANNTERTMLCKLPTAEKFFQWWRTSKGNREHLLEVIDVNVLKKNKGQSEKSLEVNKS